MVKAPPTLLCRGLAGIVGYTEPHTTDVCLSAVWCERGQPLRRL